MQRRGDVAVQQRADGVDGHGLLEVVLRHIIFLLSVPQAVPAIIMLNIGMKRMHAYANIAGKMCHSEEQCLVIYSIIFMFQ
jgi:hypothetical protein